MNEKSNKLISLLTTLDRPQRRACRKLIKSPFFSANEDLLLFFDALVGRLDKGKPLNKKEVWLSVFDRKKAFNDTRFRKYTSDLFKLIKEYLIQETLEQEPELRRYLYFSALEKQRTTKLIKGVERNWDDLTDLKDEKAPIQYLYLHLFEKKKHNLLRYAQRINDRSNLEEISRALDIYFVISKLKDSVEAISRNVNGKQNYELHFTNEVVAFLDSENEYLKYPLVAAYYYIYKMLTDEDSEPAYYSYKDILLGRHPSLTIVPNYNFIGSALNYCVVKIAKGQRSFMKEYLEVYQFALDNDIAFEDDSINPSSFKNTVQIAMQLGEFDWAETYIRTYQDRLPESDKVNTVNYNLAMVYFYQKKFSDAQDHLRQVEYTNIDLNLNTKMLLLAIYYELGEDTVLESFFDSTISYLNRHKELTTTRDRSYRNLVLYTRRLTRLLPNDKAGHEKLKSELQNEKYVASKSWLEEKIAAFNR
jgi:hypothetical protein